METAFVILVIWAVFGRLSSVTPSSTKDTSSVPQEHSKGLSKQGDQPSVTKATVEDHPTYDSSKCYTYEGLLNNMFPLKYLTDPVRDLEMTYVSTNLDLHPDEKYYLNVLKTNDAVQRGLLKPVPKTLRYHSEGMRSEVFLTAPGFFENRLISHTDIARARRYFRDKKERECGAFDDHHVHHTHGNKKEEQKCLESGQIRDLVREMDKISINAAPGLIYYKLVLRTNRAVHCKQLTIVEGTLITGALGVKTQDYVFEQDKSIMRLASVSDRQQARTFFRERKQKSQNPSSARKSNSESDAGQNGNIKKAMTAAAGAEEKTYKTDDSSSDSSDDKHNGGEKKAMVVSEMKSKPGGVETHTDAPLYPSNGEHETMTSHKCLESDQVRDLESEMDKISIDAAPGLMYYKLVVRTNRAVHCKQLTIVEGTLITGALGVKTQEYVFEQDKSKVRLASISDLQQARMFFRERKQKSQNGSSAVKSNSQNDAGHNDNVNKGITAADRAAAMTHKTDDSSSDSSDDTHNGGYGKTMVASALTTQPAGVETHVDVPLYSSNTEHVTKITQSSDDEFIKHNFEVYPALPYGRLLNRFHDILKNTKDNNGVISAKDQSTLGQLTQDMLEDCAVGKLQEYMGYDKNDFQNSAGIPTKIYQVMISKVTRDSHYWVLPEVNCKGARRVY